MGWIMARKKTRVGLLADLCYILLDTEYTVDARVLCQDRLGGDKRILFNNGMEGKRNRIGICDNTGLRANTAAKIYSP